MVSGVYYDFQDAAGGAGYYGGFAGHGFEVDDAEGLVDGRAAEDSGVAVELDLLGHADHLLDPDDAWTLGLRGGDGSFHFRGDLRRVGRPGTKDHLEAGREMLDG